MLTTKFLLIEQGKVYDAVLKRKCLKKKIET